LLAGDGSIALCQRKIKFGVSESGVEGLPIVATSSCIIGLTELADKRIRARSANLWD
jgi:hypothetical protein